MKALPELEHREARFTSSPHYGTAVMEALFMASRGGERFNRWNEALLRPGIKWQRARGPGNSDLAWHPVETKSRFEGAPPGAFLYYASESYWTGGSCEVRRYTLRLDGFVPLSTTMIGGESLNRTSTFTGNRLDLNVSTSAAGSVRVEFQGPDGRPLPGFAAADARPVRRLDRPRRLLEIRPRFRNAFRQTGSHPVDPERCGHLLVPDL